MIKYKKASGAVGGGIIVFAILLLLGGIFLDGDSVDFSSKDNYREDKKNNEDYPREDYLFYLNDTSLGKQQRVTQNFPNIELGSKTSYNTIFVEPYIELRSNPFTKSEVKLSIDSPKEKDVEQYLIYATPNVISGNALLEVRVNGTLEAQRKVTSSSFPLTINSLPKNVTTPITISLEKPFFLNLFSWNKVELNDLRIVEQSKDVNNQKREFNFQVNRDFLDKAFVDVTVSCESKKEVSEPIKISVNGYIISNENPKCLSNYNRISAEIPLNILNSNNNSLTLETNGFYSLGYSIDTVYFNDQDVYKFNINSFNDVIDVVMYGDFDKEVIDLKINDQIMTLRRDEVKSIIPYLRFGTNELEFMTKPIEFEEFVIEKNEFYSFEN